MRGINKGQTIHFFVIPEVRDLIARELCKPSPVDFMSPSSSNEQVLRDINCWLVVNSMKSERIQFNQLTIQNVSNIWRKVAFKQLLLTYPDF